MFADLVEQQTTTTGTGSYVVSGSVAGRRTFASAFAADTKTIPYVVTDDVGGFEVGIGDWTVSTTTLSRVVIIASSNAGAAVSWAAGTRRIYLTPHSGVETAGTRNNFATTTTTAPATTDNLTAGYGVGSRWLQRDANGTGRMYECLGFIGASAIWTEMARVSKPGIAAGIGRVIIGQGTQTTPGAIAVPALNGFGIRGGFDTTGGTTNYADGFTAFTMWAHTTNATTTELSHSDTTYTPLQGIYLPANTSASIEALVTATTGSGGDRAMWKLVICAKGGSTPTVDVATGTTALFASAGASAWTVAVAATTGSKITISVTGAAATDIMWSAAITGAVAGKV